MVLLLVGFVMGAVLAVLLEHLWLWHGRWSTGWTFGVARALGAVLALGLVVAALALWFRVVVDGGEVSW